MSDGHFRILRKKEQTIYLQFLTLFSFRMKRVNRSQKSVAATQVHVRVISSRLDLSEVPGETEHQDDAKP